jgi:hypothetical protein
MRTFIRGIGGLEPTEDRMGPGSFGPREPGPVSLGQARPWPRLTLAEADCDFARQGIRAQTSSGCGIAACRSGPGLGLGWPDGAGWVWLPAVSQHAVDTHRSLVYIRRSCSLTHGLRAAITQ